MGGPNRSEGLSIAVVVLNWNGVADTLKCLASMRQSVIPLHALVVDNGSTGDDVMQIRSSGLADTIIETGENLGYAEGNNVGIRFSVNEGIDIIAILNNDTIIDSYSFKLLADQLSSIDNCAISPDIRYLHEPTRSWFPGGVMDAGWPRHLQPSEITVASGTDLRRSDWLNGCCIVARRETWEHVGLFDPAYFLVVEDVDWSFRARRCGVNLYVATESLIRHKVGGSSRSGAPSLLGNFYFVRNGLNFEAKYAPRYLPSFAVRWLLRPTVSALLRRRNARAMVFGWCGAIAFVFRVKGRAPLFIERLASRLACP